MMIEEVTVKSVKMEIECYLNAYRGIVYVDGKIVHEFGDSDKEYIREMTYMHLGLELKTLNSTEGL